MDGTDRHSDDTEISVDLPAAAAVSMERRRARASGLRGHPLHVEPVLIQTGGSLEDHDSLGHEFRLHLLRQLGFAPAEIHVVVDASLERKWSLQIHGEQVDGGELGPDDNVLMIRRALERHLFRMLGTDDVLELLAFAQLESPMTIERMVPRPVSIELLRSVLRMLLRERVPIKPLARIVESLGSRDASLNDVVGMVDRARLARRRGLVAACAQVDEAVRAMQLAPEAAASCTAAFGSSEDRRDRLRGLLVSQIVAAADGLAPVVLVSLAEHRRAALELIRPSMADVRVLGSTEVAGLEWESVATIGSGIRIAADRKRDCVVLGEMTNVDDREYLQSVECVEVEDGEISDVEVID